MNMMSSTLLTEDTGVPFDELQAEQIQVFRDAWADAGWERTPRISVSRSVIPLVTDEDREIFGPRMEGDTRDQVGFIDGGIARFGKSYIGEPDVIAADLAKDAAVAAADTLILTVPNQLGVDYNTRMLAAIAEHVAPAIGWEPARAIA
jgi:alkanesulfonate monooxygenase SsuD/methylene tetrahydromethanopterin reductase-like flavin-dependent oxidoreductase (luciferase family)